MGERKQPCDYQNVIWFLAWCLSVQFLPSHWGCLHLISNFKGTYHKNSLFQLLFLYIWVSGRPIIPQTVKEDNSVCFLWPDWITKKKMSTFSAGGLRQVLKRSISDGGWIKVYSDRQYKNNNVFLNIKICKYVLVGTQNTSMNLEISICPL